MKKIWTRVKDAIKRTYCVVYYYYYETEDYSYSEEHQDRYYSVKVNIYFPNNLGNGVINQIKEVAHNKVTQLRSGIVINFGIPTNRFYEVSELPEDSDLFPNPHDFYVVNGADIRPKLISKKGAILSLGLDGVQCYIRKRELENISNMTEKEQRKFVAAVEKTPPKYVRGTYKYGNLSTSVWFDSWVVKTHFVNGGPDAPILFYQHSDPALRYIHDESYPIV